MNKLPRSWVTVKSGKKSLSASCPLPQSEAGIKVLQWNVLADGLAQNGNFVNVPSSLLEWERRWPLILTEIQEANADVVCLQEVNKYDDFFKPVMKEAGYKSFYLPKQKSPAVKYGAPSDGCVIFYRASKFELKTEPLAKCYQNEDGSTMNQGFIILSLVDKTENRNFIIATTHLKAKNGTENEEARNLQVRVLCTDEGTQEWCVFVQVSQLLDELHQLQSGMEIDDSEEVPVIVCGDFNDEPQSQSCHLMRRNVTFPFLSIWDFKVDTEEEPSPITTYKWRPGGLAKRVIDYVWYPTPQPWNLTPRTKLCRRFFSQGDLDLVSRWSMLSDSQIGEKGLPMDGYGSDHIALCAQFRWKNRNRFKT